MIKPKIKLEVPLEPFIIYGARRLTDAHSKEVFDHLENTVGLSATLAIRGYVVSGYLTEVQAKSFGKEVFRETYNSVLRTSKKTKSYDKDSIYDFPSATVEQGLLERVDSWIGVKPEPFLLRRLIAVSYLGAALDLMCQKRPQMIISGRIITECCSTVTALTLVALNS
jgi:hypothetical protein